MDLKQVVSYSNQDVDAKVKNGLMAYEGEGTLVNSGEFGGMDAWGDGKQKMADWLIDKKLAEWKTTYHLRDWLISRQRYWGPPIPMVFLRRVRKKGRRKMEEGRRNGRVVSGAGGSVAGVIAGY